MNTDQHGSEGKESSNCLHRTDPNHRFPRCSSSVFHPCFIRVSSVLIRVDPCFNLRKSNDRLSCKTGAGTRDRRNGPGRILGHSPRLDTITIVRLALPILGYAVRLR